jgi:hypothetical protein
LPSTLVSWSSEAERLLKEHSEDVLTTGWLPPKDAEALQKIR